MTRFDDLTRNSILGTNGKYLVGSKKKEDALKASTQVWEGGLIIVVSYEGVNYVKMTDGAKPFSQLGSEGGGTTVTSNDISDATTVGKQVLTATNAAAARAAIGAGTSNLVIGTTASTAMAGNTPIPAAATWANISGKPAVVASGADQAAARASIGAGTSSLAIGTTSSTAKAGDYQPTWAQVTGKPNVALKEVTIREMTASGALVLADASNMVDMNSATAVTLTIPLNSTVAFPIGTQIIINQQGAGQVTFAPEGAVVINSASGNLKLTSQYSVATLIKKATNTWLLSGNLTT